MHNDLISIVVTTHNGSSSIVRCVESAFAQDYDNFEVIVVDDNGRESKEQVKTEALLRQFFTSKPNFKYIAHEVNINGSAARNTGILNSSGAYIAFLDDDDVLHPNSIRLRYELLDTKTSDYGFVFSSFTQYQDGVNTFDCVYELDGNIMCDYLKQKIHSPSSVLMVRRDVFNVVGLWDESFKRHQDWEFIVRLSEHYKMCSIPDKTVDRYITLRNNAKDPLVFEEQRIYFLTKMDRYIHTLDKQNQKEVYFNHYIDIGKNYLKNGRFVKALSWACKSGCFVGAIALYVKATISYFKSKL